MARKRGGGLGVGIGAALFASAGFGGAQAIPVAPAQAQALPGQPYPGGQVWSGVHRINAGETVLYRFRMQPSTAVGVISAVARVVYDNGQEEDFAILYSNASTNTVNPWVSRTVAAGMTNYIGGTNPGQAKTAQYPGWITDLVIFDSGTTAMKKGEAYAEAWIGAVDGNDIAMRDLLGKGYLFGIDTSPDMGAVFLNQFQPLDFLATYVIQGTVAEDATAGTHVCSLTVTPGAGNEMQVLGGRIAVGATATAQTAQSNITDGTNIVMDLLNPAATSTTVSGLVFNIVNGASRFDVYAAASDPGSAQANYIVSGTMQLILKVTTTAVSVTQTFAVVLGIRYGVPTATLADSVGTPTLTTNTSGVF